MKNNQTDIQRLKPHAADPPKYNYPSCKPQQCEKNSTSVTLTIHVKNDQRKYNKNTNV